ncbi:MAG: hypothetical protein ACOC80_12250, partial [Petrotogales bacterium]
VIEGSWELPGEVKRVFVYKKEGLAPSGVGDGEEVPLIGLTRFADKNVQNGQSYSYKVFCEFVDINGSKVLTKGVEATATPDSPPPPLLDYNITREESKVFLTWKPLEKGSVGIYKSTKAPKFKEGEIVTKSELNGLGNLISTSGNDYAVDNSSSYGIYFYTPVTFENELAVVGRTQKLTFVEDITNLRAENLGPFIRLKWKWPSECKEVLVSWRHDMFPMNAEDTKSRGECITKAQYDLKGGFLLNNPKSQDYFFKVFAGYRNEKDVLYSSGIGQESKAKVSIHVGKINYTIKKGFLRKYKIIIQSDSLIEEVPELILVAKKGKVPPLNTSDGLEVFKVRGVSIRPGNPYEGEINASNIPKPSYLKLFFSSESSYNSYKVEHPTPKEVCIK